jgi:hypothetical protein
MQSYNNPPYYSSAKFIPPKIEHICWKYIRMRTFGFREFRIAAEINNDSDKFGLFKNPVNIYALYKKGSNIRRIRNFFESSSILYLLPKQKYLYISSFFLMESYYKKTIKFELNLPKLNWENFSGLSFPETKISNDRLITLNGKNILKFDLTNLSNPKHSFQVNVGLYNSKGKLIGGAMGIAHYNIRKNVPKPMKIEIPFELPSDCKYVIQTYADTPALLFFLRRESRKKNK